MGCLRKTLDRGPPGNDDDNLWQDYKQSSTYLDQRDPTPNSLPTANPCPVEQKPLKPCHHTLSHFSRQQFLLRRGTGLLGCSNRFRKAVRTNGSCRRLSTLRPELRGGFFFSIPVGSQCCEFSFRVCFAGMLRQKGQWH